MLLLMLILILMHIQPSIQGLQPPEHYASNSILHSTLLYSTILYSTLLYYTLLYYTLLYYTILYYTRRRRDSRPPARTLPIRAEATSIYLSICVYIYIYIYIYLSLSLYIYIYVIFAKACQINHGRL